MMFTHDILRPLLWAVFLYMIAVVAAKVERGSTEGSSVRFVAVGVDVLASIACLICAIWTVVNAAKWAWGVMTG